MLSFMECGAQAARVEGKSGVKQKRVWHFIAAVVAAVAAKAVSAGATLRFAPSATALHKNAQCFAVRIQFYGHSLK
jgi:hypothetical protein